MKYLMLITCLVLVGCISTTADVYAPYFKAAMKLCKEHRGIENITINQVNGRHLEVTCRDLSKFTATQEVIAKDKAQ